MKTRATIALLTTLLVLPAIAQEDHEEKINGLRAGWHMSDLIGDEDLDVRHGYYFGYYRNWIKVPLVSLSAGLEVNTAGAIDSDLDAEQRLTYLTLPINGRLKFGPVYFDLGIDAAVKLHEKLLVGGAEVMPGERGETFDALYHVGAGFKFLFLGVEARYRNAFTEVYDGYKNNGLQVGLITFF